MAEINDVYGSVYQNLLDAGSYRRAVERLPESGRQRDSGKSAEE